MPGFGWLDSELTTNPPAPAAIARASRIASSKSPRATDRRIDAFWITFSPIGRHARRDDGDVLASAGGGVFVDHRAFHRSGRRGAGGVAGVVGAGAPDGE